MCEICSDLIREVVCVRCMCVCECMSITLSLEI
jgi:hypothetical protein